MVELKGKDKVVVSFFYPLFGFQKHKKYVRTFLASAFYKVVPTFIAANLMLTAISFFTIANGSRTENDARILLIAGSVCVIARNIFLTRQGALCTMDTGEIERVRISWIGLLDIVSLALAVIAPLSYFVRGQVSGLAWLAILASAIVAIVPLLIIANALFVGLDRSYPN